MFCYFIFLYFMLKPENPNFLFKEYYIGFAIYLVN